MTFTEVLSSARQLRPSEKIRLIRLLAEDLDGGEDLLASLDGKVCELPTPYESFGAARILADALAEAKKPGK